jgi:pimeloyl-ACP methyl ester carboxylesterase
MRHTRPMTSPDVSYARSGEVAIAYQVVGDGPTDIVFVRGITGDLLSTWEQPLLVRHVEGLAAIGRVLMLDKRGTGLSDRVREVQSTETAMDDIRAVMDAARSSSAVLWGGGSSTGTNALFAATYPERCMGLVFFDPTVKGTRTADYPWARTTDAWRQRLAEVRAGWGDRAYLEGLAREWAPGAASDAAFRDWFVWHMRRSLSPGAALTAFRTEMELDVSDILSAVRVPTLIFPRPSNPGPAHYAAERIRGSQVVDLPPFDGVYTWADDDAHEATMAETARFVSRLAGSESTERVLATILFTDIVGSTELAARLGDRAWRELLERHHAIVRRELARFRGRGARHGRGRVLRVVRRPRPRGPGGCRAPRPAAIHRPRDPVGPPHRRVRGERRQDRRDRRLDRRAHLVARRARRDPRVEHRQGSRRRLRHALRGPG